MQLNDWRKTPIIVKDKIRAFEFLQTNNLIEEIEDSYFYLKESLEITEAIYYTECVNILADELGIVSIEVEIKDFIRKINLFNELKDIGQSLMGKLAELRGITVKELHDEYGLS